MIPAQPLPYPGRSTSRRTAAADSAASASAASRRAAPQSVARTACLASGYPGRRHRELADSQSEQQGDGRRVPGQLAAHRHPSPAGGGRARRPGRSGAARPGAARRRARPPRRCRDRRRARTAPGRSCPARRSPPAARTPRRVRAAAGTSTMIPTSIRSGTATPAAARDSRAACSERSRARRSSSTVATIGNMTPHRVVGGHPQHGAQLGGQQLRVAQAQADPPEAQEGVLLLLERQVRQLLVGAGVQGAHRQRAAAEAFGHRPVGPLLLVLVRQVVGLEEQELGAQQPDAVGAGGQRPREIVRARRRWPPPAPSRRRGSRPAGEPRRAASASSRSRRARRPRPPAPRRPAGRR